MELRDLAADLWVWRVEHPAWQPGFDWEPLVASTCVESGGETIVLDPLAPPDEASEVWQRLDARPPTMVVVLKPDHVRDVDLFVGRYGGRAFGPWLFWRDDIPETKLEPIEPGSKLPGGLVALYDGRGRNETPLWLPEQRALVFADALTAPGGELRVWSAPSLGERALPALRALLELPFEYVIVSTATRCTTAPRTSELSSSRPGAASAATCGCAHAPSCSCPSASTSSMWTVDAGSPELATAVRTMASTHLTAENVASTGVSSRPNRVLREPV